MAKDNQEKLEVRFKLPELQNQIVATLEIPEGNGLIVYEGKFYDLKPVFQKRTVKDLYLFGKVNLRRTDVRKEKRFQKPDMTLFTPQEVEVEVPEEAWVIGDTGDSDRRLLFAGRDGKQDYVEMLHICAYNNGIWLKPEKIIEPIFATIEKRVDDWYSEVYKMFNVKEE
jgi:hypothetical protein